MSLSDPHEISLILRFWKEVQKCSHESFYGLEFGGKAVNKWAHIGTGMHMLFVQTDPLNIYEDGFGTNHTKVSKSIL